MSASPFESTREKLTRIERRPTAVLLVEDEPAYARLIREALAEADGETYEVTWTMSLDAALGRLASGSLFDIALVDLGLPDADGTEALAMISARSPATPIVVLSAQHDLDVALESMRLGAQEYLVKGQAEDVLLPRAMRYALERKRLQDVVASARAEAEHANAVKDDFLAMLGHELRNPLAPIVTALALMRVRSGAASMARELTVVERQVQHLVRLVDDLLDVARIERGKLELSKGTIDLADVVDDGLESARPLIAGRHRLEVDVLRACLFVDGDRARLAQVAANLLTNAAKYTPAGGRIRVSAGQENGFAVLRVNDSGVGMTREFLERVFDRFEQGDRAIDRSVGGLGLGLAIVRSIVTMHGGTVGATSEGAGKGSEFMVRLPLAVAPANGTQAIPPGSGPVTTKAPRRVLVVDDNEDGAELLDLALRTMGHTTRTAHDGPTALVAAKEFEPDVALLDIGLPEMDGYEVARRLRAMYAGRPLLLVALTGYGQESDRARSRAAGFDLHLVKPVDLSVLEDVFSGRRPLDGHS
jgi:signal transduction histidine kinase